MQQPLPDISHPHSSPAERYRHDLERPGFEHDAAQARMVKRLDHLYRELLVASERSFSQRLLDRFRKNRKPVRGLYIWGKVGRGKTYLMDCFYEALPFPEKQRLHFHHFMHAIHAELKTLRDLEDPLATVASRWADKTRVICFDEFVVTDIADATLLGRLLRHLFDRNVTLVATSNTAPDNLYKNGLKRELFLPAIALIKKNTQVLHCADGDDYRLRQLTQARLYYTPADADAHQALEERFRAIAGMPGKTNQPLTIEGRKIVAKRTGDGVAWFDFNAICKGPRSANDYIEIARLFHTVIVSDIPPLGKDNEAESRRLIALVDEFYDRSIKLIMSAAVPITELYKGQKLRMPFERTRSRLIEMQSKGYLARPRSQ